jgi:hypothetical protein
LVTDGCFYGNKGMFLVASPLELKKLEAIFIHGSSSFQYFRSVNNLQPKLG